MCVLLFQVEELKIDSEGNVILSQSVGSEKRHQEDEASDAVSCNLHRFNFDLQLSLLLCY